MALENGFVIEGIEPLDIDLYGEHARREFWRAVVLIGLKVKDAELAKGRDRFGKPLTKIAPSTRKYRKSWTGQADPNAPPLTPAYSGSRTRALLDGRATRSRAEFFWRRDPVTGRPWSRILNFHRRGRGNLPVRDVIGISPASLKQVKAEALAAWSKIKAGVPRGGLAGGRPAPVPPAASVVTPKTFKVPQAPAKIKVVGRTDLQNAVLAGGENSPSAAAIAAGQATGFRQFKAPPAKGKGAKKPAPVPAPILPAKVFQPAQHPPVTPRGRKPSGRQPALGGPEYFHPPKPKPFQAAEHPPVAERTRKPVGRQPAQGGAEYFNIPPGTSKPKKAPAKPKATPKPKPPAWPDSPDALEVVRGLGGSTGAELVKDAKGNLFVRKRGKNPGHLREEATADAAYRALGVAVPESKIYETAAGPVKLAKWVEGKTLADVMTSDPELAAKAMEDLRRNFVADALLANWDVVGLSFDNILVTPAGKAYRIDNGGALRYRAQGGAKNSQWNTLVSELDSLRKASVNASSAKVFGAVTDAEIKAQAKALVKKRAKILAAVPEDLRAVLGARLDTLAKIATAKPPKPIKGFKPLPASDFKQLSHAEGETWGQEHYKQWASSLSSAEKSAVRVYTGSGYHALNGALRSGHVDQLTRQTVDTLSEALHRGQLSHGLVVNRGISGDLSVFGLDPATLRPGMVLKDPAFWSTTVKPTASFGGAVKFEIRLPKGTPGAYVNAARGSSQHPGEMEFLIPAGSVQFRIVEYKKVDSSHHLVLQWEKPKTS